MAHKCDRMCSPCAVPASVLITCERRNDLSRNGSLTRSDVAKLQFTRSIDERDAELPRASHELSTTRPGFFRQTWSKRSALRKPTLQTGIIIRLFMAWRADGQNEGSRGLDLGVVSSGRGICPNER